MIDIRNAFHHLGWPLQWRWRTIVIVCRMDPVLRILLLHRRQVFRDDEIRLSDLHDSTMLQPHRAVPELLYIAGGVRYEKYRNAAPPQLLYFSYATLPEIDIAHSERLIDQQN